MQPEQPTQPPQPPQPAPVQQPPVAQPQPPQAPVGQPAFGSQAQPIALPSTDAFKQIRNAGGAVFALGIFFAALFSLVLVVGLINSLSNTGEGIIMALFSVLYILFGVVLITQGKKLQRETDTAKAGAMMKSMAIGLSVLSVVALLAGSWLAVIMFVVTAIYLFVTSSKVTKG